MYLWWDLWDDHIVKKESRQHGCLQGIYIDQAERVWKDLDNLTITGTILGASKLTVIPTVGHYIWRRIVLDCVLLPDTLSWTKKIASLVLQIDYVAGNFAIVLEDRYVRKP